MATDVQWLHLRVLLILLIILAYAARTCLIAY